MEKKKLYIFVTHYIGDVAGTQMYTAGKVKYLKECGWQIRILCNGPRQTKALMPLLDEYIWDGSGLNFIMTEPYKLPKYQQEYFLNLMVQRLNLSPNEYYDIIIESHCDWQAYWAELLAAKIGARHFFIACDEAYRKDHRNEASGNRNYESNLDFFYFKWKRNELVGNESVLKKLFNGYKNVAAPLVEMPPTVQEMYPIQDIDFPIEKIKKLDWNICHIGRMAKKYVSHAIKGIGELARRYPDKKINFIMVGSPYDRTELLKQTFQNCPNVFFILLGDMVPIPRNLFSKIDVVCAISQSARFAANEGVLTICGTVDKPDKTSGVLGYDTKEAINGEPIFTYVEALENVLVKRLYDDQEYGLPKIEPAEKAYENFWTIVKNASPVKEYYVKRLTDERIRNWTAIFPFASIARGARIILFGATEIAKDYKKQIESQSNVKFEFGRDYMKVMQGFPYCEIVAMTDVHPEEFDDSVVNPE